MTDTLWISDFQLSTRLVRVKKTGAEVAISPAVAGEVASWFGFYLAIRAKAAFTRRGPKVWFAPDRPRPWYLVWAAAAWACAQVVDDTAHAEAADYL